MSSKNLMSVDEQSFREVVLEADVPVMLELGAQWCPPCRALEPILQRLAERHAGRLKVLTLDMDACPAIASRYKVRAAPTILVLRRGEELARHVGLTSIEKLEALVTRATA